MRIRKRHALLSSSHFPPTPPSDPHRSPGLVQLTTANLHHRQRGSDHGAQPSDQPVAPINGWDDSSGESGAHRQHIKQDPSVEDDYDYDDGRREDSGEDSEDKKSNHSRKGNIFGSSQTLPPAPPLNLQVLYADERWCEEEKAIPFKKRRGSFDNMGISDGKKTKARMKTKMNNKCSNSKSEEEKVKGKKKKKGRGSAVMEGSRCSRVNGRGWRCCQQTLVGYSLCEHHLGKGRLRSMTSVRNRSTTTKVVVQQQQQQQQQHPHDHGNNNNNPSSSSSSDKLSVKTIMGGSSSNKRKMKQLGMVKARSINSLLGQTTNTPIAHT
ncbi:uncharacterized protein [Arachis hypogaea]|uniref:uncharacterized protein isoform X1 n=1 Tax=Arachis hypogaea TaxID=3818 RepID=UPI000DEC1003|nr:uncharacterized protein LOC112696125 isoform X1 [Arachis hypogaea]XP_029143289.1 uncharacterized protein LOC112696125 isoform X1 [Arachis hypogaea]